MNFEINYWLLMCALVFAAYEYGKSMGRFTKLKMPSSPAQKSSLFHELLASSDYIAKCHSQSVAKSTEDIGPVLGHAMLVYFQHDGGHAWFWQAKGMLEDSFLESALDTVREISSELSPAGAPKPTIGVPDQVQ